MQRDMLLYIASSVVFSFYWNRTVQITVEKNFIKTDIREYKMI